MRAEGVRREAATALLVVAGVVVVSLLVGALWGVLAPTEQLLVTQPGRGTGLTGESAHQFDAVAIFVCFGAVTGLLSAVAAWRLLRPVRGPLLQLGLLTGSLIGAYAMAWCGETVAELRHPRAEDPAVGSIVTLPTEVGTDLALLVQPLIASLVVLFLAALSTAEDLGTGYLGPFGHARPTPTWGAVPAYDDPGALDPARPVHPEARQTR